MSLAFKLASTDSAVIKEPLISLLDKITSPEVLILDKEFKESPNKHAFLAEFESHANASPRRNPNLLERWTHYCWIRLELTYLINQKASLNYLQKLKDHSKIIVSQEALAPPFTASEMCGLPFKEFQRRITDRTPIPRNPLMIPQLDSIHRAIQEDAEQGVPIEESIRIIEQMTLQIVGTEHPTDPLSQDARDTLTKIAEAMSEANPSEDNLLMLLSNLTKTDAIPHVKRTVAEEVNRNICITLSPLYDNVPTLVQEILDAYRMHYGEAAYLLHEQRILTAIGGGIDASGNRIPPLLRDAFWPGSDADGNTYVTARAMRDSNRLYRIRASEKHMETLETTVSKSAKTIERELRRSLIRLRGQLFAETSKITDPAVQREMTNILWKTQDTISEFLIDREFAELIPIYESLRQTFESLSIENKAALLELNGQQLKCAQTLLHLTQFSGSYKEDDKALVGDVQRFHAIFAQYRDDIRDNTDAIYIDGIPASEYVVQKFRQLIEKHRGLLENHPELKTQLRNFGIQLNCYGMTYGVGHIRQDSSVFINVWKALLSDLITNPKFSNYPILQPLKNRDYSLLSEAERFELHKQLQNNSQESLNLLGAIRQKYKNSEYASSNNPEFSLVTLELERLEVANAHPDMYEKMIISNAEGASNISEVKSLLRIVSNASDSPKLRIVPLLEKRQDLENYENILLDYIKTKLQEMLESDTKQPPVLHQYKEEIKRLLETKGRAEFAEFLQKVPEIKTHLKNIVIEIMVGFSDTERVSGVSALIAIQKVQEEVIRLAEDFGVTPQFYYGPGGDPNRGGLRRRDQTQTLQGNARSNLFNTPQSTHWFRENQFYQAYQRLKNPSKRMEISNMPPEMQAWLETCMKEGESFYEHLHDEKGLGKLMGFYLGKGIHWMVSILNSSSRAAQRGGSENAGDRTASVQTNGLPPEPYITIEKLRAITATQMKEMLCDYLDFLGPGSGLRKIGLERAGWLFDHSETFRDMVIKINMSMDIQNLDYLEHALFDGYPELIATDNVQLQEWAAECRNTYADRLTTLNIKKMCTESDNQQELMKMLSRLFAFIKVESAETQCFLKKMTHTMGLTTHYPVLEQEIKNVRSEAEPLHYLLARQANFVAKGKPLDQIYAGLNKQTIANSRLSGVGRLLANIGAGITAARVTQPGYNEKLLLDYSQNISRPGFNRAKSEASQLGKTVNFLRFFGVGEKEGLETTPSSRLANVRS